MAKLEPNLRTTETYTETNFLRLQSVGGIAGSEPLVTIEHFSYSAAPSGPGPAGWTCLTIVDAEAMNHKDAIFIARCYAAEHGVPVIYQCLAS